MKCLLLCWDIIHWSRLARCTFVAQVMALGDDWCGFADAEDPAPRWKPPVFGPTMTDENNDTVTWLNSRQRDICFGKNRIETRARGYNGYEKRNTWGGSGASSQWLASIPWGTSEKTLRLLHLTWEREKRKQKKQDRGRKGWSWWWRWWEVSGRWDLPGTGLRSLGSRKQCDFRNWSQHAPVPTRPSHLRSRNGCKQWC